MTSQKIYTIGGTVQAGGGIYIKRKADDDLLDLCRQGELAFILSSRQVGKSSLMMRVAVQLESENIRSVVIDLSAIGVKVSPDEWYLGILNEIRNTLNLKTDIFLWWKQQSQLGHAQRLMNFLRDVVLKEVKERIVLFFDEIDTTLSIPFSDDFYVALRAVYNARSTTPDFKRLSFVLIGVAAPSDLISDNRRTPFNIGRRVELADFTIDEALPLAKGLGAKAEQVLMWIFHFTGGHPYLTQRLCAHLAKYKNDLTETIVASAVDELFIGEKGKQDNNLQFVRDMLAKRSPDVRKVLLTYRSIRSGKSVADDEHSTTKIHLKLSGLVRSEKGFLRVRNEIYNSVFTSQWIQENTPRNWTKIAVIGFAVTTFALLIIFGQTFVVGNLGNRYSLDFYATPIGSERLKNLAKLFELEGVLQTSDYDFEARSLFYGLNWVEQTSLFTDPKITLADKEKYLPTVIKGLYITLANVDGGQDSTNLLSVMENSLNELGSTESVNLQNELRLWIDARNATIGQDAINKYAEAILLNNNNPATHYELGVALFRAGLYEQGLDELNVTMGLAQNLSNEKFEGEQITPTYSLMITNEPTITALSGATIGTPTAVPTPIGAISTLSLSSDYHAGYKSIFYTDTYIRSAIDLILSKQIEKDGFLSALNKKRSELIYLNDASLIEITPAVQIAPNEFVIFYFDTLIFQKDFEKGWLLLTPDYQETKAGGWNQYTEFWSTVENWTHSIVSTEYNDGTRARVLITYRLYYYNGNSDQVDGVRYCLLWNNVIATWQLDIRENCP